MTTVGYLILITALLLLAAAMIYVRIARRSRGNDLPHHDLGPISFEPSAISTPGSEGKPSVGSRLFPEIEEESPAQELEVKVEISNSEDSSLNDNGDYLDDLQDAAAGLARLMHSSPVDRTEPDVEIQEKVELEAVLPVAEESAVEESAVETEGLAEDPVINRVEAVLGEEVVDQIERIDTELDALEELVASIEESLEAFSALSTEDDLDAVGLAESDSLPEAA